MSEVLSVSDAAVSTAQTTRTTTRVSLASGISLLLRPPQSIQFGVLPQESVVLPLPPPVHPMQVIHVLSEARTPIAPQQLAEGLAHCGLDITHAHGILAELQTVGILRPVARSQRVAILQTGKAAEELGSALAARQVLVDTVSEHDLATFLVSARTTPKILLLPGMVFPPDNILYALAESCCPHFPTGMVDGNLVAGPLVVPGHTACLTCLDLHYQRQDRNWRAVRAQAVGRGQSRIPRLSALHAALVAELLIAHALPWISACTPARLGPPPEPLRRRSSTYITDHQMISQPVQPAPQCPSCALSLSETARWEAVRLERRAAQEER